MSFLEQLTKKKLNLKPTETLVTYADGKQEITQNGEKTAKLVQSNKSYGFVVDTKPDFIPACILDNKLYLGSQDAVDLSILNEYKITHILSIGIEAPNLHMLDNKIKTFIPCLDLPETNLKDTIIEANKFINNSFKTLNSRVLVHCNAGISRSSSIVIGFLILELKYSFNDAYELVKLKRECIQPNQGFLQQLKQL